MKFASLQLGGWRQFQKIEIDFHDRMTIITGANGSGKSTILRLLASHFGWQNQLLSTPTDAKEGGLRYFHGAHRKLLRKMFSQNVNRVQNGVAQQAVQQQSVILIGAIKYSNGISSEIGVPEHAGVNYNAQLTAQQVVPGLYIPSHRQVSNYQQVISIPTNPVDANFAYQVYFQALLHRYNNNLNPQIPSPMYRMKEALIAMATFGPGNQFVPKNERVAGLFEHFKEILKELLPTSLGFEYIGVRVPDLVLVTKTGDFLLDSASGGLMSIIDLAWQIFLYSQNQTEFIVALDEPENHLHPSMQREVLAKLLAAFPGVQFVIATHSPFIVSSVKDSAVYALQYGDSSEADLPTNRSVSSTRLDLHSRASSASDILREVLGVPVTLPIWAEDELERISARFATADLNEIGIAQLRGELALAGLGDFYPEALAKVTSGQ